MLNKVEILEVNKLVFDYIMNLDESTIVELIKGEKKLTINDTKKEEDTIIAKDSGQAVNKKKKTVNKKEKVNINNDSNTGIVEEGKKLLSTGLSREEAVSYFSNKVFTVPVLKKLAKEIDVYVKSRSTKGEIIDKLIEGTIGARLKMKALKEK